MRFAKLDEESFVMLTKMQNLKKLDISFLKIDNKSLSCKKLEQIKLSLKNCEIIYEEVPFDEW